MHETSLDRFARGGAAAFAAATLAVYPLYIDKFSNLGLTKFTGVFMLTLLWLLLLGACAAIGAATLPCRFGPAVLREPGKEDPPLRRWLCTHDTALLALGAFAAASTLGTAVSLSPLSSLWGLGSYYGGLMLVLLTAGGYLFARALVRRADFGWLTLCVGATVAVVAVLYTLNIFNIDLIGAYADTAVVEQAQFFSTLGQKDFNAGYLSVALPLVFWAFLEARDRVHLILYGVPALFGTLALAVVDSEGLLLGIGGAMMVLVCHKTFDEQQLRRAALLGAGFFGWAGWMHYMRATVYTQGGTAALAELGAPAIAVPGGLLCLALWAVFCLRSRLQKKAGTAGPGLRLYLPGRIATAAVLALAAGLFWAANFWPGYRSLGPADQYLIFNGDWGTYRGTAWMAALGAWADAPLWRKLLGYGPGMMHEAVLRWAGPDASDRLKTFYAAHNEYLEQLLTTGLLGLGAWLWFVAAHLRRGFRRWGAPAVTPILLGLTSYLLQAVVSIRVSMIFPEVMLLFGLLAGFTAAGADPAMAYRPLPEEKAARPGRARGRAARAAAPPAPDLSAGARAVYYGKLTAGAVASMALAAPLSVLLQAALHG